MAVMKEFKVSNSQSSLSLPKINSQSDLGAVAGYHANSTTSLHMVADGRYRSRNDIIRKSSSYQPGQHSFVEPPPVGGVFHGTTQLPSFKMGQFNFDSIPNQSEGKNGNADQHGALMKRITLNNWQKLSEARNDLLKKSRELLQAKLNDSNQRQQRRNSRHSSSNSNSLDLLMPSTVSISNVPRDQRAKPKSKFDHSVLEPIQASMNNSQRLNDASMNESENTSFDMNMTVPLESKLPQAQVANQQRKKMKKSNKH